MMVRSRYGSAALARFHDVLGAAGAFDADCADDAVEGGTDWATATVSAQPQNGTENKVKAMANARVIETELIARCDRKPMILPVAIIANGFASHKQSIGAC